MQKSLFDECKYYDEYRNILGMVDFYKKNKNYISAEILGNINTGDILLLYKSTFFPIVMTQYKPSTYGIIIKDPIFINTRQQNNSFDIFVLFININDANEYDISVTSLIDLIKVYNGAIYLINLKNDYRGYFLEYYMANISKIVSRNYYYTTSDNNYDNLSDIEKYMEYIYTQIIKNSDKNILQLVCDSTIFSEKKILKSYSSYVHYIYNTY